MTDAARRAGLIVNEQINSIVEVVERQADEIRREAEHDARATRRDAAESAQRVLERINALERPLGELVQTLRVEMDRVQGEIEDHVDAGATAIPARVENDTLPAVRDLESAVDEIEQQLDAAGETREHEPPPDPTEAATKPAPIEAEDVEAEAVEAEADEPESPLRPATQDVPLSDWPAAEEPAPAPPSRDKSEPPDDGPFEREGPLMVSPDAGSEPEKKPRRGFSLPFKGGRAKGAFITTQGHCAVCQKTFMAGSEENLRLSGWKVSGDVGVCPECQADGWQLPEGAKLPFRRGGG